jgi:hypothetical protein
MDFSAQFAISAFSEAQQSGVIGLATGPCLGSPKKFSTSRGVL